MSGLHQRSVKGQRDAKNRDMQCIVVSDCCTAVANSDARDHRVLPLPVRVRTTDEVIAALRSDGDGALR